MALRKRAQGKKHSDSDSDSSSCKQEVSQHSKQELAQTVVALRKEKSRHFFSSRRFLFPLGVFVGVLLGFILIQPTDFTDFQTHLALLLDQYDINVPQFPQFDFPQLDLTLFESEWRKFRSSIPEPWKLNNNGLEFTVGEAMAARGLTAKHPVVLIPGIISTGLESWSTNPEYRPFFRQKLWGGFSMLSQVMFNKERWMSAIMLDPISGLDPPGAKVRAAEGIDAASSFIQGYWLWSKIVENLAVVNYDTNNLHLAPYDWRLSYYNLEKRDGYFTKLKATIEGFKTRDDRRVVLVAHSMGSTVMMVGLLAKIQPQSLIAGLVFPLFLRAVSTNSFKWVESPEHGKGGPDWVENHIEALVTIAGTHLGVVKAMSAFLSGEMRDTVQINPAGAYVLERFFSRKERQKLFRSWAGSASMWMKGGEAVWGNATFAPDDMSDEAHGHGDLIVFRQSVVETEGVSSTLTNMTATDAGTWILERTSAHFQQMIASNYSFGIERDEDVLRRNNLDHRKWSNPLEIQQMCCVPLTPRYTRGEYEYDDIQPDMLNPTCANTTDCTSPLSPLNMPFSRKSHIDSDYTDESISPKVINGVRMGEGDGTVNLLSLGAMCVEGWKRKRWNPAGIEVVTVEASLSALTVSRVPPDQSNLAQLPHNPVPTIPRGGGTTSDHVDILGSTALNEIVLKVATGAGDEVHDSFVSRIREYAGRVQWD
ncbi:uncharacterized protein FIBRA_02182 [Fibroporia radiculosa]|uniref:Phospholipid:diacylglycerol acyltransferase n=1 Tax=Fibroporia radiculosa TaxID=599839 RepID=J4H1P9_9APHY|nr:uncharacterized protein FIBRA_02182 [Fibroporia radiculosa]CCM00154.1 predicted protein [Fibroporia radiculosa]